MFIILALFILRSLVIDSVIFEELEKEAKDEAEVPRLLERTRGRVYRDRACFFLSVLGVFESIVPANGEFIWATIYGLDF